MVFKLPLEIKEIISKARQKQQKIVMVTGVFDLIHQEHLKFLKKAKQEGDVLLIGVESDKRVKTLKGENRPINSQQQRLNNLLELNIADGVFVLPEEFSQKSDHVALLKMVLPDILAISSHSPFQDEKRVITGELGIALKVVHQFNPQISTTLMIKNSLKSRK